MWVVCFVKCVVLVMCLGWVYWLSVLVRCIGEVCWLGVIVRLGVRGRLCVVCLFPEHECSNVTGHSNEVTLLGALSLH